MRNYSFTVFTPCYNGEKTIHRVFESMAAQTYNNWEWIIVNDGSTDNSDKVIKDLIKKFPPHYANRITYLKQDNCGKHRTWNRVVEMAKGDFFIPADCDDSFVSETLAFFNDAINKEEDINKISGINVCCYDSETKQIVGCPYERDGLLSDNIELNYRYHVVGEHWGCLRTDLLKRYRFPDIEGHYYSESYLWYSFPRDGYKVRCYNKALRAYFYQPESLTHNQSYRLLYSKCFMELQITWWKLRNVGHLIRKYSKKSYFKLYVQLVKNIIKCVAAKVFNNVKQS